MEVPFKGLPTFYFKMQKEIEQFKRESNGTFVKYSTKEMVGGIYKKLEKIETRLNDGEIRFTEIESTLNFRGWMMKTILPAQYLILWAAQGGVYILVLKLHGII